MSSNILHPNGSVWRKWDLHVHSPSTKLQDNFQISEGADVWDKFCDVIEGSDVEVFGITDYFSVDNHFIFVDKFKAKYPLSKKVFFPNIEFRLEVSVNSTAEEVNLHVIFSDKVEKAKIESFLSKLNTNISRNGAVVSCKDLLTQNDFVSAGIDYKTLRKVLSEVFGDDNCYLVVAASNNAGLRPDNNSPRKLNITDEIDKICDCFFGGQQNTDYYLGINRYENGEIAKKKPVISGCDAHSFDELEKWLGKRYVKIAEGRQVPEKDITWIKAETTFEGLKQIIYEPKERVRVQEHNPFDDRKKLYLNSIRIVGSNNFIIPDIEILLNRELVTVIGGRGSGKSALLESIAFLNEEHAKKDQNNKPKVIEFYRRNIEGKEPAPGFDLETELTDKDNNKEQHKKSLENDDSLELPFLYIGQEQLSGLATNDKELTEKICELINLDFAELKKTELVEQAREYLADIENIQAEINDLYGKYSDYKDGDFVLWLEKFIEKKGEQKKKLSSRETKDLLNDIGKTTERGLKLRDLKQSFDQLKFSLKNTGINVQISTLNKTLKEIYPEDLATIPNIDFTQQDKYIVEKQAFIDGEMGKLRAIIIEKKKTLIALGLKEDISVLLQSAEVIEREINNAKKDKETYGLKLGQLKELITLRSKLFGVIVNYLKVNATEIDNKFIEFKVSRDESTVEEKELFLSITEDVSVEGEIIFDQDIFSKYLLENCFDKRVVKSMEDVKALIAKRNEKGVAKDITLESLKKWIEEELDAFLLSDSLNLRGRENLTDFLFTRWSDFLRVRAIVKLKGTPTEKLSVGQRGTLLLKIYLATATVKQIFIVDQPEDNLDNQFIMNELVPLVRQIKKSRQIILSTHNANLVVNADAEQVIVARLDGKKRDYVSGGIENKFINKSIKEILEGGEEAFRSRENKYGMGTI